MENAVENTEQTNSNNSNFIKLGGIIVFIAMIGLGGYFWISNSESQRKEIEALIETNPSLAVNKLDGYISKGDMSEWLKKVFPIAYSKLIEANPTLAASKIESYLQKDKSPEWLNQAVSVAYLSLIEANPVLATNILDHYIQQHDAPEWVKQDFPIAYFKLIEVNPAIAASKLESYLMKGNGSKWLKKAASIAYFRLIETNSVLATKRLDHYIQQDDVPKWVKQDFTIAYFKSIETHNGMVDYYDTFRTLMGLSALSDIKSHFKFIEALEKDDAENNLFVGNKDELETYYFYYDTGRIFSYKRGFALTEKSLIWKNMFQSVHVIGFDDINHISLHYEKGFSLTGWNIIINNNEDLSIRLSEVSDENLLHFLNNILLYINSNRSKPSKIILEIPSSEQKILAGSTWERHSGTIITALTTIVFVAAEKSIPNQANAIKASARQALVSLASKVAARMPVAVRNNASNLSKYMAGMASKSKMIANDAKARAISLGRGIAVTAKALPKSFKSFKVFDSSGKVIGKYKIKDLYKSEDVVRMPYKGIKGINVPNTLSVTFWKGVLKNNPKAAKALSSNNKKLIESGKTPMVDPKWVKSHPSFEKFLGKKLTNDYRQEIKGVNVPNSAPVSYRGFERNNSKFWKEFLKKPNAKKELSQNNIRLIKRGRSPVVDDQWIESRIDKKWSHSRQLRIRRLYQQFKDKKEPLEHHHLNHGPKVIPLPRSLHRGAGNYKIMHTE